MESILIILFGIGICALYIWVGRQFVSQSRTPMGNVIYRSTTGSQNIDLKKRRTLYLLYHTSGLVTLIWSLLSVVIALKFNVFLGFISTFFSFGIPSIFFNYRNDRIKKEKYDNIYNCCTYNCFCNYNILKSTHSAQIWFLGFRGHHLHESDNYAFLSSHLAR